MGTQYKYFSIILILILLLASAGGLSCTCNLPQSAANTKATTAAQPTQATSEKGDPDWWKKQPDLKKEDQTIQTVMTDFGKALAAKDIKQVASYFSPDTREKYSQALALSPEALPQMAKDMEKANLSFLSLDTDFDLSRIAEYQFKIDGNTFSIVFIKIDGKWMIESF